MKLPFLFPCRFESTGMAAARIRFRMLWGSIVVAVCLALCASAQAPPQNPAGSQQPPASNQGFGPAPRFASTRVRPRVIVTTDGTPTAPAPTVAMMTGDLIVSTGAQWIHVPLHHAAVTAANVAVTAINSHSWSNVQNALSQLYTLMTTAGTVAVVADDVSIVGDGTTADPLMVSLIDGGTF